MPHLSNHNPSFGAAESEYDFFREAAWIRRFSKKIILGFCNLFLLNHGIGKKLVCHQGAQAV